MGYYGKKIRTHHGLNYVLSDDVFTEVIRVDGGTDNIWARLNGIIESRALLPNMVGCIVFTVLAILHFEPWHVCIIALASELFTYFIRSILFLYKIPIITILTNIYQFFSAIFLDKIAVILIAIFLLHNWIVGAVYVVAEFILSWIFCRSYKISVPFNDKAAKELIRKFS